MATKKKLAKKTTQKTIKKAPKVTGKLTIECDEDNNAVVNIDGDMQALTAALAGLLEDESEDNGFGIMMRMAIEVIMFKSRFGN